MGWGSKRDSAAEAKQASNLKRWEKTQKAPAALAAGATSWEQMLKDGPSPGGMPSFLASQAREMARGTIDQWKPMWDRATELKDQYGGFFDQVGAYARTLSGPDREAILRGDETARQEAMTRVAEQRGKLGRLQALTGVASTEAGIQAATDAARKGAAGAFGAMGPQMQTAHAYSRMQNNLLTNTAGIASNRAAAQGNLALARAQGDLGMLGNAADIAGANQAMNRDILPQQMLQGASAAQQALGMQGALAALPLTATNQITQSMQPLKGGTAVSAPAMFNERVIPKKKTFLGSLVGGIGSGIVGGLTGGIGMGIMTGLGSAMGGGSPNNYAQGGGGGGWLSGGGSGWGIPTPTGAYNKGGGLNPVNSLTQPVNNSNFQVGNMFGYTPGSGWHWGRQTGAG